MIGLKFGSILIIVIIFNVFEDCNSFSIKIPSNLLELNQLKFKLSSKRVPTSFSSVTVQDPDNNADTPEYILPIPAAPSYTPGPTSDPYPAVPVSMPVPSPNIYMPGPGSLEVAAPQFSGPPSIMIPAPSLYGSEPVSPYSPIVATPESHLNGPLPQIPIQAPEFYGSPTLYPPEPVSAPKHRSRGIKAAYWPSFDGFPAASINASYFTHIYYAFLLPEPETFKLNITSFDQTKIPEFINTLGTQNPPVKTILSIGGGGNDPTVFSRMASTDESRAAFIDSTIEVARSYGFDGVDLDWEFPADDQDMSNLAILYSQWKKALKLEAKITQRPRLSLTSAVYYPSRLTNVETRIYPIEAINSYVDWVSPMCFDYHGSWENFTGAQAALYGNISTSGGIGSWIDSGLAPYKLVMGLPLYGRTWTLQDPSVHGIGAPAVGVGPGDGILTYSQIVEFNSGNRADAQFDYGTVSYYSYSGQSWVGYDSFASIQLKIIYAKTHGLGGYFFWALGQDKDWTLSSLASNTWGR